MFEAKGVRKCYGNKTVLQDISFCLPRGKTLVILGDNGAGKSTLLQILATMLPPDGGSLRYDDLDLLLSPRLLRQVMGYVPQEPALYEELSVGDNLRFWADMSGLSADEQRERVLALAQQFGLSNEEKTLVRKLSGGMKRRLNFCVSLFRNPEILFLDEPTAHVDAKTRDVVLDVLAALKQANKTMIYITHLREEARQLADCVLFLEQGRCAYFGEADAFFEENQ
jgi:ABC-type multidrug transport system, ATPase component